jgi:hypothetical protein
MLAGMYLSVPILRSLFLKARKGREKEVVYRHTYIKIGRKERKRKKEEPNIKQRKEGTNQENERFFKFRNMVTSIITVIFHYFPSSKWRMSLMESQFSTDSSHLKAYNEAVLQMYVLRFPLTYCGLLGSDILLYCRRIQRFGDISCFQLQDLYTKLFILWSLQL